MTLSTDAATSCRPGAAGSIARTHPKTAPPVPSFFDEPTNGLLDVITFREPSSASIRRCWTRGRIMSSSTHIMSEVEAGGQNRDHLQGRTCCGGYARRVGEPTGKKQASEHVSQAGGWEGMRGVRPI